METRTFVAFCRFKKLAAVMIILMILNTKNRVGLKRYIPVK
jgi:hypothetical protein